MVSGLAFTFAFLAPCAVAGTLFMGFLGAVMK